MNIKILYSQHIINIVFYRKISGSEMTISTQQSSQTFLGNGITNSFNFSFVGDSAADINVSYTDSSGTINILNPSQYTLFLNPPASGALWGVGGTVTYPISGSPISNGTSLTVSRVLPLTQETSISNQGPFAPDVIESALDTLEMQIQQVAARSGQYRGEWAADILYNYSDIVVDGANGANTGNYYICAITNTSSVWSANLASGDWVLAFSPSIAINVTNSTVIAQGSIQPISLGARFGQRLNVKDFGAVGDGVTDDTAAFIAARNAWEVAIITNPAPGADSNKLGGCPTIGVPPGNYLITSPQAMLDSAFTTPTAGMEWEGMGAPAECQILYQPSSSGALIYNNDAVLQLRFRNLSFNADSSSSDFMYSISTGKSQDYGFENCVWNGIWGYGVQLQGNNSNSEFYWNNCAIYGTWTTYLYSVTSDQFLNYWFNQCKIWSFDGKFIRMILGGHIKINECDFSNYSPSSGSVLFSLEGVTHALGVCSFVDRGSRYELKNAHSKVMYSEWPQGLVTFDSVDYSSQSTLNPGATTLITHDFEPGNNIGADVQFNNCQLMGLHKYVVGNSSFSFKKTVQYIDCYNGNFRDLYDMFQTSLDAGNNYGGLPCIRLTKCKGYQTNYLSEYAAWAPTHPYTNGQVVRSSEWVYTCTVSGTSGSNQPYGAGTVADNTVTWVSQTIYPTIEYVTEGGVNASTATDCANARKVTVIHDVNGGWPARINASVPGTTRVVLPPNSIITAIYINLPAGVLSQGTSGTYKVETDESSPTTFINVTSGGALSAGLTASYGGYFNCGTSLATRAILLQAQTDVLQNALHPAICFIEYICGE